EAGVRVLDQPFVAHGNVATAGGCLASHYLAAWVIARLAGWSAAESVVQYVAPVGQKEECVERTRAVVQQYLPEHERVANLAGGPRVESGHGASAPSHTTVRS